MADVRVISWRDIPAQVIVRDGRSTAKRQLSARFSEAIDMAAMRAGLRESDDYLGQWTRSAPVACGSDIEAEATAHADRLEAEYDDLTLKALAANDGYRPKAPA